MMKCAWACFLRLVVLVVALRVVSECSMDTFVSPFSMTQRCPARPPFSRRFLTRSLLHRRGPSWGSRWLPVCLLLLSGDVDPNPGPVLQAQWKYPCGVCSRAVRSNQKGIFCEVCLQWLHTKCINLSNANYDRLSSSDEGWCCSRCLKEALPFHNCSSDCLDTSCSVTTLCSQSVSPSVSPVANSNSSLCSIYYSNCRSLIPKLDHLCTIAT